MIYVTSYFEINFKHVILLAECFAISPLDFLPLFTLSSPCVTYGIHNVYVTPSSAQVLTAKYRTFYIDKPASVVLTLGTTFVPLRHILQAHSKRYSFSKKTVYQR